MQESSKSTQTIEEYVKALEERVAHLEEELQKIPTSLNFMYRRPGRTQHEKLATYLDDVESRLLAIELRQELGM